MRGPGAVRRRLRALFRRGTVEQEMHDELALHYELAVADALRRGVPEPEARRRARQEFGGADAVADAYRDARGTRWAEQAWRDARYAVRSLRATPAFTIVAGLTLALGIGATTAVFSVVHGVLLRPLPYADAGRLAIVWETDRDSGTEREEGSVPDFFDYRERARSFAALSAFARTPMNRTGDGEPERVQAARVTGDFFATLGVAPALGRWFRAEEDAPGGPRAAVISARYWRARFDGAPTALGRTLRLDDVPYTVVGVAPDDVALPDAGTDVWLPMQLTPASYPRSLHNVTMLARLTSGTSVADAQREMAAHAAALEREYPNENDARGVHVEPLETVLVGAVRPALMVLLGAVAVVLLIAAVNAASLMLARRAARAREVALRAALGASRRRLAAQFFIESAVLTAGAAALGLALAIGGTRALVALAPPEIPRLGAVGLHAPVLLLALGVAVAVALGFGLLPAAGGVAAAPADALKSGGARTGGASREQRRLRHTLATAEIALSLVLAISAVLLVRSFARLRAVDPGFAAQHLLTVRYQLPAARYPQSYGNYPQGWARILQFQRDLVAGVAALPGVRGAALAASDPLDPGFTNSFVIVGREEEARRGQAELPTRAVSAGYFATAGVPLLRGRAFDARDVADAPPVLIINQAAADRYFPGADPLGAQLRFWGMTREIVGVVGNERFNGLATDAAPAMYPPIAQAPMPMASLLVRTEGSPTALLPAIRAAVWALDPQLAPFDAHTMDDAIGASVARPRFLMQLVGGFAGVALLLALAGVYGVIAYAVAQRAPELGVRMALGATAGQVIRLVVAEGARLAGVGIVLGVAGALAAGRLLSSQLYSIGATDPAAYAIAAVGVLLAVLAASWIPARRAGEVRLGNGE